MSSSQSAILEIQNADANPPTVVANLLPCKIAHDGPVTATPDLWSPHPLAAEPATLEAHFRGRRLVGETVSLKKGEVGHILRLSSTNTTNVDPDTDELEEVQDFKVIGKFDEVVIWGHDKTLEEGGQLGRGLREWKDWSAVVNGVDEEDDSEEKK